jgi:Family of unknown function (DUF5763)
MSRVANALRRANAMQEAPVSTEYWPGRVVLNQDEDRPGPSRSGEVSGTQRQSAESGDVYPIGVVQAIFSGEPEALARESAGDQEPPAKSRGLRMHPLLRQRWLRRMLRFAGVRLGGPVPTCQGVTRLGVPCRGPAMANGFCRQHGGSRNGVLAERTRSLLERISLAR